MITLKLINDFFEVLDHSVDVAGFSTTIQLNPRHIVYAGHFPGHPVTPGVIQLQIVHELLEKHVGRNLQLITVLRCKFLKILNPDETPRIVVSVECNRRGEQLQIRARGQQGTAVFFKLDSAYQLV